MTLLSLQAGDYALTVSPEVGGSIRSFMWCGEPIFRTAQGSSILDSACFPLVPFCNRIADGRFEWDGLAVSIAANFPESDHPHPLHGFGWTSPWDVVSSDGRSAELVHRHGRDEWPWPYVASQRLALSETDLHLELSVENLGNRPMPAGLGFHPYFPRTTFTLLRCLHRGKWQSDQDGLPVELCEAREAKDWWQGAPVASVPVDTVYAGREGPVRIEWPDRDLCAVLDSDPRLSFTSIFVPESEHWFCVEPVTHMTNAVNSGGCATGLVALPPRETLRVSLSISATRLH